MLRSACLYTKFKTSASERRVWTADEDGAKRLEDMSGAEVALLHFAALSRNCDDSSTAEEVGVFIAERGGHWDLIPAKSVPDAVTDVKEEMPALCVPVQFAHTRCRGAPRSPCHPSHPRPPGHPQV